MAGSTHEVTPLRQLKGACRLVTVQLARVGKSFDLQQNLETAQQQGKIDAQDAAFIQRCLAMADQAETGEPPAAEDMAAAIKGLQKLAACNLNVADSA